MTPRDVDMNQMRLAGSTLQAIGDKYNLTRERVRQICDRLGAKKPPKILPIKISYNDKIKNKILSRVEKTAEGCWNWLGCTTNTGYAWISYRGNGHYGHRVSYEVFNEVELKNEGRNTSETICVLHSCDNPRCVNPEHLSLGTQQDNMRDRDAKKRCSSLRKDVN
jgi:hypothetical protein